jgi:ATP-dependent exoDNAse (exonuclease V) beta subunit
VGTRFDPAPLLERAQADARRLRTLRTAASARAKRELLEPMTAEGERARSAAERDRGRRRTAPSTAGLVGSVVHALLENVELSGDVRAALVRAQDALESRLEEAASSTPNLDSAEIGAAGARARELMRTFAGGALGSRFAALAPHVVARELALVASGDEVDGFVPVSTGAIDLVYRDPKTRELVVVDYKTDALDAAGTQAAAQRHRPQLDAYRSALQRALALARPPRAELWFLAADTVVEIA